jgi:hypothetical protein
MAKQQTDDQDVDDGRIDALTRQLLEVVEKFSKENHVDQTSVQVAEAELLIALADAIVIVVSSIGCGHCRRHMANAVRRHLRDALKDAVNNPVNHDAGDRSHLH